MDFHNVLATPLLPPPPLPPCDQPLEVLELGDKFKACISKKEGV